MIQIRWMLVAATCLLALACERGTREEERERAQTPQTSAAVVAIAAARCDREQRCGNIGAGERYVSREACVSRVRDDWKADLNAFRCESGIERDELNECVQEIRNEDCGNPFDTLGRVMACRSSDICAST